MCIIQSHYRVGQWKHQKLSSAETGKLHASFSSSPQKYHKQRGLAKYQLHMEEAKRGIDGGLILQEIAS